MKINPNKPLTVGIAIVVIIAVILLINSARLGVVQGPVNNFENQSIPSSNPQSNQGLIPKSSLYARAPELAGIAGYVNANDSLTLASLKGKVVLIDFWTYSCINCIRTLPYLKAWDSMYRDKGLVIIGVHTPEFDFEKDYANVEMAVKKFGITYPVVLDNNHGTWSAYQNLYWPREYLIDSEGFIRHDKIGEGDYDSTEKNIQALLMERNKMLSIGGLASNNVSVNYDLGKVGTPEIYLGYGFARQNLGNKEGFHPDEIVNYSLPTNIEPNLVYFSGSWKNNLDNMELVSDTGKIVLTFKAKNVNIVSGSNSSLSLKLDGVTPKTGSLGSDAVLVDSVAQTTVGVQRLYGLINKDDYSQATITIEVNNKGFKAYSFTFG